MTDLDITIAFGIAMFVIGYLLGVYL